MIQKHMSHTHRRRQQGHVAHNRNTLDSQPQESNFFLLFLPPSVLQPFLLFLPALFLPTRLSIAHSSQNITYFYIFIRTEARSLLSPAAPAYFPATSHTAFLCSSRSLSLLLLSLLLSVCLTAVVDFCIAMFFLTQIFFFPPPLLRVLYIYISDVRNKRNLYIQWFFFFPFLSDKV